MNINKEKEVGIGWIRISQFDRKNIKIIRALFLWFCVHFKNEQTILMEPILLH